VSLLPHAHKLLIGRAILFDRGGVIDHNGHNLEVGEFIAHLSQLGRRSIAAFRASGAY
jgi:hypothetical protein